MTQALTSALLHFVWQGALVAFLLWVTLSLLRNRSANARYIASCAALALMATLPLITACVIYQRPVAATASEILAAVPRGTVAASFQIEKWLLPGWCLGVLVFSLRLLWGCGQVAAIRRRGESADAKVLATATEVAMRMRLTRPVRVLISSVANGPSAIGWIRPVILLPAATVLGLTREQLEAVIAHELAHIRRHDYLVNIIQMLVETVLFYHPAVWWTSARIRHERELCCDDAAVGCCGDALCYARALTTLERLRITTPRLAVGSTGGSMLYRIERLVGVAKYQNSPARWPGLMAICLGLAVFAANTNWAQGQAQPKVVDEPGVKTDFGKSAVTNRTPVEYPEAALEKKVQGTVIVEATVDKAGAVSDARVVSGPTELRKAALQSVLEWQFTPESGGDKRRVSISFQTPPGSDQGDRAKHLEELRLRDTEERAAGLQDADQLIEQLGHLRGGDVYREVEDLKEKLEAARRAQELENANDGKRDAARREQQALETREFLEQQLKQAELQAVEAQRNIQQQLRQQEDARPQLREILDRLRESQQGALPEQVSQSAQVTEQLKMLQLQMENLRAEAEALRTQLQEQQKSQPK